jgi:transposase-like protein
MELTIYLPLSRTARKNTRTHTYSRHRFRPDIIQHAVWLYFRVALSH